MCNKEKRQLREDFLGDIESYIRLKIQQHEALTGDVVEDIEVFIDKTFYLDSDKRTAPAYIRGLITPLVCGDNLNV